MDAYKVGIHIALTNGVSPALAIIGRDLLGLKTKIGDIEKGFGKWATAIGGAAAILGGTAIAGGLMKIAKHGEKLLDQQDQLQRGGLQLNEVLKLQSDYYEKIAKQVPTSTASGYLATVKELRAVTGGGPEGTAEAAALAVKALKVDALLSNTFGHESHGEYYKLLRAEEMKGIATDPAKREQFVDQAFANITAFGGKLTARDYQTLARRGGAAFINATPEAMGPLSVFTADLGGDSAGTTMMTFHQLMTGANTMSKQQAQAWQDIGMIDMAKTTKTGFGGGRLQLGLGALKGSQDYSGNLPGWIHEVLYPAIAKAADGDKAKIEQYISKLAPNRNANKMIHMFGEEGFQDQIRKDLGLAAQVEPLGTAYKHFIERNPKGVDQAFNKQWESMLEAIGSPLMQAAMPVMKSVTEMFTQLGAFANNNPETIKQIGKVLAALSIGLVAIGGIALATLVSLPLAIGGVVTALTAFAALNWDMLKSGLTSVRDALAGFVDWLAGLAGRLGSMFGFGGKSGEADPDGRPKKNALFEPGAGSQRSRPLSLTLNVDGRALAQVVTDLQEDLHMFPRGAPSPDGSGRHFSGDHNMYGL